MWHGHGAIVPVYRVYEVAHSFRRGPARVRGDRGRLRQQRRRRCGLAECCAGEAAGRARLQDRRLLWLSHPQGREREGPGRAEPRRAEARRGDRGVPGADGRKRHAGIRRPPVEHADRPGRVVRVEGRQELRPGVGVQARQDDDRELRKDQRTVLLPPGVREPRLQGRPREGAGRRSRRTTSRSPGCTPTATRSSHWSVAPASSTTTTMRVSRSPRRDDVQLRLLPRRDRDGLLRAPRAGHRQGEEALLRSGSEHERFPALPVRARPRARSDDLQHRRPALVAQGLPQAPTSSTRSPARAASSCRTSTRRWASRST